MNECRLHANRPTIKAEERTYFHEPVSIVLDQDTRFRNMTSLQSRLNTVFLSTDVIWGRGERGVQQFRNILSSSGRAHFKIYGISTITNILPPPKDTFVYYRLDSIIRTPVNWIQKLNANYNNRPNISFYLNQLFTK